jgi:multisubunit Na+/H+ antiporter MnhC subunit
MGDDERVLYMLLATSIVIALCLGAVVLFTYWRDMRKLHDRYRRRHHRVQVPTLADEIRQHFKSTKKG